MGLFDKLFHKTPKGSTFAPTMNGFAPLYTQYGTSIYASDVVQQALTCIVGELKKLNPMHVRVTDGDSIPVKSTIQDVLNEPNPLMTKSEFIEKIAWLLLLNYNAFIVPVYDTWIDDKTGAERRYYKALYPLKPSNVDFIEDASGELFVKFYFWNGKNTTYPYSDVIHIRYQYSVNEYMGGNELGQPDHEALLKTLELNEQLLKGVAKAMNASYAVNGVLKYNSYLDKEDMQARIADFEARLARNESGILPIDLKADFTPLERKTNIVDENTLKFVDEKILRNFGVPLDILRGDFSQDTYNAFYQKTLEGIIIAMGQAFTKKLFTDREKAFGNRVEFYPKDLIFMTVDQTIRMIELLSPTGALFENEKRTVLGMRPKQELEGKRYMSLNWIEADKAAQYQTGANVNLDIVDENREEV